MNVHVYILADVNKYVRLIPRFPPRKISSIIGTITISSFFVLFYLFFNVFTLDSVRRRQIYLDAWGFLVKAVANLKITLALLSLVNI